MIAFDSSSILAYLAGERGADVERVDQALESGNGYFPPVVLTELLSAAKLPGELRRHFLAIPRLELTDGYWQRAGELRQKVLLHKRKARLADTLIAQSCIDHHATLVTRDKDFAHFARVSTLKLLP